MGLLNPQQTESRGLLARSRPTVTPTPIAPTPQPTSLARKAYNAVTEPFKNIYNTGVGEIASQMFPGIRVLAGKLTGEDTTPYKELLARNQANLKKPIIDPVTGKIDKEVMDIWANAAIGASSGIQKIGAGGAAKEFAKQQAAKAAKATAAEEYAVQQTAKARGLAKNALSEPAIVPPSNSGIRVGGFLRQLKTTPPAVTVPKTPTTPKFIQPAETGVVSPETSPEIDQLKTQIEILKDQVASNPLSQNKANDRLLYSREGDVLELGDVKTPARSRFIEDRMAEAGIKDPKQFVEEFQKLKDTEARIKALEQQVKVAKVKAPAIAKTSLQKLSTKELVDRYAATGRAAFYYPNKKIVSLNGLGKSEIQGRQDMISLLSKEVPEVNKQITRGTGELIRITDKTTPRVESAIPPSPKLKTSAEGIPLSTKKIEARLAQQPPIQPPPPPRGPTSELPALPPKGQPAKKIPLSPPIPVPTSIYGLTKRNLAPLKFVDPETQKILRDWNANKLKATEAANKLAQSIKIPGDSMDLIDKYQAGEDIPQKAQIKKIFDNLRNEAIAKGADVKYRENYVPQVYKGTPAKIQEAILDYLREHGVNDEMAMDYVNGVKPLPEDMALRLKVSPSFEKERVFENYKVAEEYGLKPKFTKISDLAGYYKGELEKTINNKTLIDSLIQQGKVVAEFKAPKEWTVLNTEFTGGKTYRASPNLANVINNIFEDPNQAGLLNVIARKAGRTSRVMQEVALSAGVPGTTVNFFSIGQLYKELAAGNYKAVAAFVRANSNTATIKWFTEHQQTLDDMAAQGIDVTDRVGTFGRESVKDLVTSGELRKAVGASLEKVFGEKTFDSMMPQLQAQLFEDVAKSGIAQGLSEAEAKKIAGDVVRNNFGINTDAFARGKLTSDVLSSIFFAPRFRESIIGALSNTGKAGWDVAKYVGTGGKSKIDPGLSRNRRLLVGMILLYGIYNAINKQQNDQYMWENPSGRKFSLRIPRANGEVIYVDFFPSFLSFARNIASGVIAGVQGDVSTATQQIGGVFSMPMKIGFEVLANQDYFGNPIYKDTDTPAQKAKKIAKFVNLQVNHPYIKEIMNQIEQKKPLYQSLSVALELPLKFSTGDKESTSRFYDALDAKRIEAAQTRSAFTPKFDEIQKLIRDGKIDEANAKLKELTDEEYKIYKSMKTTLKSSDTFSGKAAMFDTYNKMQDLIKQGKIEEATTILESFSNEEYKYYQLLKKQFGS
jgi:hypothetical protein